MAYAKTSLRAEQRALRDRMRALGLDHRQIAFEFARRYKLRPRAAWRHAHGWSLTEAAQRINSYATQAGIDRTGMTVAMTGPHLCEVEAWPGHGTEPTGRRPTPYLLSLLAAAYGCAVQDLLDLADYQHMRPADRLTLGKCHPSLDSRNAGQTPGPHSVQPADRPPVPSADSEGKPTALTGEATVGPDWRPVPVSAAGNPAMPSQWSGSQGPEPAPVWTQPMEPNGGRPGAVLPVLGLDEIRQFMAALENARRYADRAVADHFRRQLTACAANDGIKGPKETLPLVLAIIAAIEHEVRDAKPAVRNELLAAGALGAEFAGWLYRDSAAPGLAGYWQDRAAEWAQIAGDQALQSYVLLKKSQLAWDARDAQRMLIFAQAAQQRSQDLPLRVQSEALQQEARGYAMLRGDIGFIRAKLDEARGLLADEQPDASDADPALAAHYGASLLALQTAICYCEIGLTGQAVELYEEHLTVEGFSRRDYGYFRALSGLALASDGRPDEASAAGREALNLAIATSSARTMKELTRLLAQLHPWPDRPAVQSLHRELTASVSQAL